MVVLSHRGASPAREPNKYPENTLDSFVQAKKLGADGIETDVALTKDDKLVLFHDRSINGTSIHRLSVKQINSKVGYKVTLLEDLLDWAPDDFLLNLEIKHPRCVPQFIEQYKKYNKRYLVTSFWHNAVWKIAKTFDNIDCGIILSCRPVFVKTFLQYVPIAMTHLVWDYSVFDEGITLTLPRFKHFVYNVDKEKILARSVDGVISDHTAMHVRNKKDRAKVAINTKFKKSYK